MAYIPDEVILRQYSELTPSAVVVYAYYCARRNKQSGGWNCPKEKVLSAIKGLSERAYFRAKCELISKKWIVEKKDFISPVVGFETAKNVTQSAKNVSHIYYKDKTTYKTSPQNPVDNDRRFEKKSAQTLDSSEKSSDLAAVAILENWLDQCAIVAGARSRHTMADLYNWKKNCIKAIEDGIPLKNFLELAKSEVVRCAGQPQFFSPNNILKQLQIISATTQQILPPTRSDDEKLADFDKQHYFNRKLHKIKI